MSQAAPTAFNVVPIINAISAQTTVLDTSLTNIYDLVNADTNGLLEALTDTQFEIISELQSINANLQDIQAFGGGVGEGELEPSLIPDAFLTDLEEAIATLRAGGTATVEGGPRADFGAFEVDPKKAKKTKKEVDGLFNQIVGVAGPIGLVVGALEAFGFLTPIMDVLNAFVSILSVSFQPVLLTVMDVLLDLIPPFQILVDAITPVVGIIVDSLKPTLDLIVPIFTAIVVAVVPIVEALLPLVAIFLDFVFILNPILQILPLIVPLLELVGILLNFLIPPLTALITPLADISGRILDLTTNISNLATDGLTGFVDGIKNKMNSLSTIATDAVGDFADRIRTGITDAFDDAIEGIGDFGEGIKEKIKGWFK